MRGSRHEAHLVEVELVDESAPEPLDHEHADGRLGPHLRGRHRLLMIVSALGVVAFVVGVNVVDVWRERVRVAALAGVPGILAPQAGPLDVTWRVPGWLNNGAGDVVLVDGQQGLRGVDPISGAVLWSRDGTRQDDWVSESCQPLGSAADRWFWGSSTLAEPSAPPDAERADLLGCVDPASSYQGGSAYPDGPVVVTVVDAATGRERGQVTVPGTLLWLDSAGTDGVVAVRTPSGHLGVVRWDPFTGEERWRVTSTEAIFGVSAQGPVEWRVDADTVVVTANRSAAVSLTTGAEVEPSTAVDESSWPGTAILPDGAVASWRYQADGSITGQVTDPDGVRFRLSAAVWTPTTSDGSVPEVMVTSGLYGSNLMGLDVATGDVLWTAEPGGGYPVLRLDGVLVVNDGDSVRALDLHDGSTLWRVQVSSTLYYQGLSDGAVVLVPERDGDGTALVARGLRDGEERWRSVLPDGASGLFVLPDGEVVVAVQDAVVGLG